MRLKWMFILVHLEIVLILTQDSYSVCTERTIVTRLKWNLVSVCMETVLVSVQDRSMICTKHTIGS
jgi:hypothetical protein